MQNSILHKKSPQITTYCAKPLGQAYRGLSTYLSTFTPRQQKWQQCDGTRRGCMGLCRTVWDAAPRTPKPQGAGSIPVPPASSHPSTKAAFNEQVEKPLLCCYGVLTTLLTAVAQCSVQFGFDGRDRSLGCGTGRNVPSNCGSAPVGGPTVPVCRSQLLRPPQLLQLLRQPLFATHGLRDLLPLSMETPLKVQLTMLDIRKVQMA